MSTANVLFPLIPVLMMVGIALTNNLYNHQRADRKVDLEASRLRAGLRAELHALLGLFEKNLQLLDGKCDYLLSSRSLIAIYKGNLGRVTALLDEDVIEKVVASFAQNEKIEALLTACAQPKGGSSYRILPGEIDLQEVRQMYETAMPTIVEAYRALQGGDAHRGNPTIELPQLPAFEERARKAA